MTLDELRDEVLRRMNDHGAYTHIPTTPTGTARDAFNAYFEAKIHDDVRRNVRDDEQQRIRRAKYLGVIRTPAAEAELQRRGDECLPKRVTP